MTAEKLRVELGERSYEIVIGPGIVRSAGEYLGEFLARPHVAIITDETVAGLHLETLETALRAGGIEAVSIRVPPGEASKSWQILQQCVEWLLSERIERDDLVVALGGGVIGDLAGFAAAILRRGVGLVQIPTTLLAQVDSSVGGKTGINSPKGKNLVGAFHQPRLVLADTTVLKTLREREFLAGYGEVVKYGLLGDEGLFSWLESNGRAIASGDDAALRHAVFSSCRMKADIVARDEREQGDRALLNLGHTFGHALEAATGYSGRLLHGEGVAIGCVLAFELSRRLGFCPQEEPGRVRAHLSAMGMKCDLGQIEGELPGADGLLSLMAQDKKVRDGRIVYILARRIGEAFVARDIDPSIVRDMLRDALEGRT
ncbi:MAG: 3-dehydroquinate synthase [Paracoccaceae bacterium]